MDKGNAEGHRSATESESTKLQSVPGTLGESKGTEVSSTAIVKYSAVDILPYNRLQQDTDLNVAPPNWLRDGRFSDFEHHRRNPVEFSSFGMAHSFVDSIGDVDVISDAENIKKLLKIPYSVKSEVSLAVHRVGQTLLLDSLDVPALIAYASQARGANIDPSWLYDFYCEQTGIPKDAHFERKKKNKDQAKLRHIFSKFLHYSIQNHNGEGSAVPSSKPFTSPEAAPVESVLIDDAEAVPPASAESFSGPSDVSAGKASSLFGPIIYETEEGASLPQLHQESSFQRNVLWQFEDIQMLVGSDLPIFGGGKYPAVSLRLRDCGNPINVLTGLDYWLDNLMCNVPEVAMCYHLDGIVQYYDLYKTEELPDLDGSQFSPKVVKDIAQNILSFMKSNCTREGHTYWLFKESDSEVVKLYDLTSICHQKTVDKTENLFTVPVAMLFYRVAKNMMNRSPLTTVEQGTVRQLLNNCLLLLDNLKFPEIFTSASYLLSDLYSPDDVHALPAINRTDQEDTTEGEESYFDDLDSSGRLSYSSEEDDTMVLKSLDVTKLSAPGGRQDDWIKVLNIEHTPYSKMAVSKPLPSDVEERCKVALTHIMKGLLCLKGNPLEGTTQEEALRRESPRSEGTPTPSQTSTMPTDAAASSSPPQAVVASYAKKLEPYKRKKTPLVVIRPTHWQDKSANLLFRKAAAVYHSLACVFNSNGKYGRGLKNCKLAFKCLEACSGIVGGAESKECKELLISVMYVCGDSYLMLAKCQENLAVHQEDFRFMCEEDELISEAAERYLVDQPTHLSGVKFVSDVEKNLLKSVGLYDAALELTTESTKPDQLVNLARRLGNVKNEIGVFYMNKAAAMMNTETTPSTEERNLWKKSFSHFESGICSFEATDDCANKALLLSNLGRLMRLCAQAVGGLENKATGTRGEFSPEERGYFNKAFEFYNRALRCLAERKTCPEVWDTVTWELSGTYFSMATLLQDFAPLSTHAQEQVEQDVTELMMKALRLCEPSAPRSVPHARPQSTQQLDQRIATIHHRLASLYHNSYRNQAVDHAKKKARSLAELHYSKSTTYLKAAHYPCEWIRIQLERVAMCEYHVTIHGGSMATIRTLQTALDHIFLTREALDSVVMKLRKANECKPARDCTETRAGANLEELDTLIPILESRLTSVLKELVKVSSMLKNKGKSTKDRGGLDTAKQMYSVALRRCAAGVSKPLVERCQEIAETLENLAEIKKEAH